MRRSSTTYPSRHPACLIRLTASVAADAPSRRPARLRRSVLAAGKVSTEEGAHSRMETLPKEFELPGGSKAGLRAVAPEDEEFLVRVYAGTREDELARVPWSEEQKDAFVRQQCDAQRREYEAHYPDAEYDVILLDGEHAGRVWVGRDEEEIHLLDIALLREAQNRGVGAAILGALIEESRRTGKRLRHMVFVMNTDALRFYERLGFVAFEEVGPYLHMEWRGGAEGGA